MNARRHLASLLLLFALGACDPSNGGEDGGSCDLDVTVGTDTSGSFLPVSDGDPAELILGFQGFRMLQFNLRVEGATADQAEVSAFVTVADSGVELSQRTRETALTATTDGFDIEEWLVFFNDEPASSLVGREADIEVVVRAAGCVGGARATVLVRDDDECVDTTITVDAGGVMDAGVGDATVCEGGL